LRQVSTAKGWAFVAVTSVVFFLLLWRLGWRCAAPRPPRPSRSIAKSSGRRCSTTPRRGSPAGGDRIVEASENAGRLFGYAPDELIGMSISDLSPAVQPDGSDSREAASRHLATARRAR